ncbi:STAS domain-containing protein [Streptomyces sp. NPDC097619]|uniref:STAS domain-containing protein n=1 Tax=Streptomyces sp. NPDC097619 TaxID=3157228 RepID=UPI00332A4438
MQDRFTVEVLPADGAVVLRVAGELDHDTAGPLRAALEEALAGEGPTRLVIDCTGLEFCDSTGLNTLLRARLAAREGGGDVELAALNRTVARLFRITGADGIFPVHRDLAEALATPPAEDRP